MRSPFDARDSVGQSSHESPKTEPEINSRVGGRFDLREYMLAIERYDANPFVHRSTGTSGQIIGDGLGAGHGRVNAVEFFAGHVLAMPRRKSFHQKVTLKQFPIRKLGGVLWIASPLITTNMAYQAIPILPSSDLDATIEFYGRLGFQVMARYRDPDEYLILRKDEIELHFFPWRDIDPWSSISGSYIRVEDLAEWYDPWAELGLPDSGIPRMTPPAETDYGMREFAIVDFDGNLHRVGQIVSREK